MKRILLSLLLFALCFTAVFFATNTNDIVFADTPTDLRNVKVGDDLSGVTIYVNYDNLSLSFLKTALKTAKYAIYQETASGRQFCYGHAAQAGSPSGTIKAWAYPTSSGYWQALGGSRIYGTVSYVLPDDFGVVTSVTDTSMLYVSASEVSKFKGLTFDDGIAPYGGLELSNTMFAVKKPVFSQSFAEMAGSSDLDEVTLFSTTYNRIVRRNTGEIVLYYSLDGGHNEEKEILWDSYSNSDSDIVYFEFPGAGRIYSNSNFIEETESWLRIITLESYTVTFVDNYENDSTSFTKRRGETISIPYISQPSIPLVRYEWVCSNKFVNDYHVEEDRTYTKTMYIDNHEVLTSYIGNMQTVNDGFPSMLKFYLVENEGGKSCVYVSIADFESIVTNKILAGDKSSCGFRIKLHSLNSAEQKDNFMFSMIMYNELADYVVGAKDEQYWYFFDNFEEVGTFNLSDMEQVQMTIKMAFNEVIFEGYKEIPVEIYGYVDAVKVVNINVPCTVYYNGELDLKLPVEFWQDYAELQLEDTLIHKFVFEEEENTNWITSDGYYIAKDVDKICIKEDTTNFVFTNNLNDNTMSFPINVDKDGRYYVIIMLDNPLQVNSTEFLANNGWRDKFESMSTLSDLKYCNDQAKAFIRSILDCNNYSNYGFGQSGYYITGLPGHTVYSNTAGETSTVIGLKVYLINEMLTIFDKTCELTLVSESDYTAEESKIPSNWVDEVFDGGSVAGNSVLDGLKSLLYIVLSIVLVVLIGKIVVKLLARNKRK